MNNYFFLLEKPYNKTLIYHSGNCTKIVDFTEVRKFSKIASNIEFITFFGKIYPLIFWGQTHVLFSYVPRSKLKQNLNF
ncbi:hypothetical protein GS511_12155 [Leptospira borgpetersenii]|uniref:Uncharacterized protein n=1 Tax=Leptospira borgpetersenii serovar Ballum TaxID=280505 RepID=A0A0S2IU11_LEPBO|nr:hypothetical protein LBBP_02915 [Leptospira borgpetersenii serovar Ballum]ANH01559.1 Uncharacterized protein LB4E_2296 [Leptospira borgpetersenii str. 4E]QHE27648.1 hypothetical protein GS524_12150 [Leptospira borgpetersenii]OOV42740.1 hypothetical protein B1H38_14425 [Leptospira borgpetersenii serovar Ballum]QHE30952.1 hypothetical protein GS523_12160 [Leptospira borgpetersenii]